MKSSDTKSSRIKSHAKVVVIGGGVVGASVLYHLTKFGWRDVVLVERAELTAGSTWHAAGGMHTINGDPNMARLQKYTVDLYREIEAYSGQDIGLHMTGGVMLAATPARFDWLKSIAGKGKYMGIDAHIISPQEAQELMPLLDPRQFVGALYDEMEGHLDPYGTTQAYAKSARKNGAEIYQQTKVEALTQQPDHSWKVETNKGPIIAEHVVNAGGLWAREVGRMAGLELPVLAMEHMYLITEDMPEVAEINAKTGKEVRHAVDFDGELYLRQERGGMLMGTYEKDCRPWMPYETSWDFAKELLEPDLERITGELELGFRHFPAFEHTGIKQIINGPFTFAPDGNPLVGPIRGKKGLWMACGVMAGFSQGGGVGLALANWMIEGDPGFDVFAMDVARFGDFATLAYTNAKVRENYSRRFSIRFPNEELPAARPLRTTPIYDRQKALGAQFGASYGLEVPLWYAPAGVKEAFSWYRSTDFEFVAAEAQAVRDGVGILETSGFAKYEITGPEAAPYLDRLLACHLPAVGRMNLAPMLKHDGGVVGDFTLGQPREGSYLLIGSGIGEDIHRRWFDAQSEGFDVQITSHSLSLVGLAIAGPKSRDLLQRVTRGDVSAEAFKFMEIRPLDIGLAQALVGRVSYTGDLGYELWMAPQDQLHIWDTLMAAGEDLGLKPFGLRALNALRLEKNFGSWGREYRPIYDAYETGLGRFVALNKAADFIGKEAATAQKAVGGRKYRLTAFIVEADRADVIGDEPLMHQGRCVGWVTSGGYAHTSKVSMALGYVPKELAGELEDWTVEILGQTLPARPHPQPLFDPSGERMRG